MKKAILGSLLAAMLAFTACGKTEVPDEAVSGGAADVSDVTTEATEEATTEVTERVDRNGDGLSLEDMAKYTQNLPEKITIVRGGKEAEVDFYKTGLEIANELGIDEPWHNLRMTSFSINPEKKKDALFNFDIQERSDENDTPYIYRCSVFSFDPEHDGSLLGVSKNTTEDDVLKVFGQPDSFYHSISDGVNSYGWEDLVIDGNAIEYLRIEFKTSRNKPLYAEKITINFDENKMLSGEVSAVTEAPEAEAKITEAPKTEVAEATTTKPPYPGYKELRAYNGMTQDEMKAHGYTANLPSEIIFAVDGGKSVEITKDITGPEIAKALGVKKLNAETNPEWVLLRPDDIEHALIVNDGMCTVTAFSEDFVFSLLGITYSTTEEDVLKTFGAPDMLSTGTMNDLNTDIFQWENVEIGGTKFNVSVMFCWNDSTPIYAYYAYISFK